MTEPLPPEQPGAVEETATEESGSKKKKKKSEEDHTTEVNTVSSPKIDRAFRPQLMNAGIRASFQRVE